MRGVALSSSLTCCASFLVIFVNVTYYELSSVFRLCMDEYERFAALLLVAIGAFSKIDEFITGYLFD